MAITVEGNNLRVRMPDGTYLTYDAGGDASSWIRFGGLTIMSGSISVNGDTTITFPYSFPNACVNVLVSEANASGWSDGSVTIYGKCVAYTSYAIVRGARKYNGGSLYGMTTGIGCNWVAIGY